MIPALDHVVINVHTDMDAAHAAFSRLGFTLTPRGHHTLGSINHLAMFDTDYLELIGVPSDGEGFRRELLNAPRGANGLVWQTSSADEEFKRLQSLAVDAGEVKAFSRPVKVETGDSEARFRTTTLNHAERYGGRVYWCEHLTPELVWRPAWQTHLNGTFEVAALDIVCADPDAAAQAYAPFCGSAHAIEGGARFRCGNFDVSLIDLERFNARSPWLPFVPKLPVQMARLGFRVYDLAACAAHLEEVGVRACTTEEGALHIHPEDAAGAFIYFTE